MRTKFDEKPSAGRQMAFSFNMIVGDCKKYPHLLQVIAKI